MSDVVIAFQTCSSSKPEKIKVAWADLLKRLDSKGFNVETIKLDDSRLGILVSLPDEILENVVKEARAKDWIAGIPTDIPEDVLSTITPAERLRMIHTRLAAPVEKGGCGLYPRDVTTSFGPFIEAMFPLHDLEFNKHWMTSLKHRVDDRQLNNVRDYFGEEVAYYFAFERFYVRWLAFPSIMSISQWILGEFSLPYGLFMVLWSVIFLAAWEKKQKELSQIWQTHHCDRIDWTSQGYRAEKDKLPKPLMGLIDTTLPVSRWYRRTITTFPILFSALLLMILNFGVFSVETWAQEYTSVDGIAKTLVAASPTLVYNIAVGPISKLLTQMAKKLNDYENYPTESARNQQLNNKLFLLQAITGFSYTLFVIYIYIPLAGKLSFLGKPASEGRLKGYVVWYMVTAQFINFVQETLVPVILRKFYKKKPSKNALSEQILQELQLPVYSPNEDLAEMCSQFGYLVLFSLAYPVVSLASYVNNVIEIRSDAFKLMVNCQRPWPRRVQGIGNWLSNMRILSFIGAITNATIWTMFSKSIRQWIHQEGSQTKDGKTFVFDPLAMLLSTFLAQLTFVVLNNLARGIAFSTPLENVVTEDWDRKAKREYLSGKGLLTPSPIRSRGVESKQLQMIDELIK